MRRNKGGLMEHSKTPWETNQIEIIKVGEDCIDIARCFYENDRSHWSSIYKPTYKQAEANAQFIVKCVNSHEMLVEACKAAIEYDNVIRNAATRSQSCDKCGCCYIEDDDMDDLYMKWMSKARQALTELEEPCERS